MSQNNKDSFLETFQDFDCTFESKADMDALLRNMVGFNLGDVENLQVLILPGSWFPFVEERAGKMMSFILFSTLKKGQVFRFRFEGCSMSGQLEMWFGFWHFHPLFFKPSLNSTSTLKITLTYQSMEELSRFI